MERISSVQPSSTEVMRILDSWGWGGGGREMGRNEDLGQLEVVGGNGSWVGGSV